MKRLIDPVIGTKYSPRKLSLRYRLQLLRSAFRDYPEETLDEFFKLLRELPSPKRERAFVQWSLGGKVPAVIYN